MKRCDYCGETENLERLRGCEDHAAITRCADEPPCLRRAWAVEFTEEIMKTHNDVIVWDESAIPKLKEIGTMFDQLERGERTEFSEEKQAEVLRGMRECFHGQLDYLNSYGKHEGVADFVVELANDFAPCSFSILWWKADGFPEKKELVFNGGLIFHGSTAETFTVSVGKPRWWGIHT